MVLSVDVVRAGIRDSRVFKLFNALITDHWKLEIVLGYGETKGGEDVIEEF